MNKKNDTQLNERNAFQMDSQPHIFMIFMQKLINWKHKVDLKFEPINIQPNYKNVYNVYMSVDPVTRSP